MTSVLIRKRRKERKLAEGKLVERNFRKRNPERQRKVRKRRIFVVERKQKQLVTQRRKERWIWCNWQVVTERRQTSRQRR